MVGMRDVAKKAGVSLSTVSLVVNGAGCVSDDMRERVAEAMRALNYVPNELARNLYHDRTNTVGVVVPTIRSSPRWRPVCSESCRSGGCVPCCARRPIRVLARPSTSTCSAGI